MTKLTDVTASAAVWHILSQPGHIGYVSSLMQAPQIQGSSVLQTFSVN